MRVRERSSIYNSSSCIRSRSHFVGKQSMDALRWNVGSLEFMMVACLSADWSRGEGTGMENRAVKLNFPFEYMVWIFVSVIFRYMAKRKNFWEVGIHEEMLPVDLPLNLLSCYTCVLLSSVGFLRSNQFSITLYCIFGWGGVVALTEGHTPFLFWFFFFLQAPLSAELDFHLCFGFLPLWKCYKGVSFCLNKAQWQCPCFK